ncbi:MAG: CspA family cold shock protein [Acetobacteraceae bacterium]|nr:CspA family cold shock protein [Acetobacteraceae bacterium]
MGWAPPPSPSRPAFRSSPIMGAGPEVDAVVKWFNADKGFGFVELGDGTGDAFLHASAIERMGSAPPVPGTQLRVRVGQGQKGRQVQEITHVGEVGPAPAQAPRAPRSGGFGGGGGYGGGGYAAREPSYQAVPTGEEITGTVKWFNAQKGFGFITPESGGKDVFVHISALNRSGMSDLREGQVVRVQVVQGRKGPEAGSISLP